MPIFKKKAPEIPVNQEIEAPTVELKSTKQEKGEQEEGTKTVNDYLTIKMSWELDILSILIEIRENLNTQNVLLNQILEVAKK